MRFKLFIVWPRICSLSPTTKKFF